jgi:hypothetical protein
VDVPEELDNDANGDLIVDSPLFFDVGVSGSLAGVSNLAVEVAVPILFAGETGGFLFPGSNPLGQTGASFISSVSCGVSDPLDLVLIGFGATHMIIDVTHCAPEAVGECAADCNEDGVVDVMDFLCFRGMVTTGDARADCNADGSIDVLDFLCFQGLVSAGCP